MDFSATQILVALAFLGWSCQPLPERMRPNRLLRARGVPKGALQLVGFAIAIVAGFAIGEWWALIVPFAATLVLAYRAWRDPEGRAELRELDSDRVVVSMFVVLIAIVEFLPVAIGVSIAQLS